MEISTAFIVGILGALFLVVGAAWPETPKAHPVKSRKNWLLAIGASIMLFYAILIFLEGQTVFFIFLQALIVLASVLMMLDTDDRFDFAILSIAGVVLIAWSLYLFEGFRTIFFILGLTGIALGYAFKMGTLRRSFALMLGGALIVIFSFIEKNWIYVGLNVFFAIFSGYYFAKGLLNQRKKRF